MAKLYNLARMTTSTTGTGTITLGSAVTGYRTFANAGIADGDVVTYAIQDGANSEIGRGTYTASGTTLARTTVLRSTNSDAAISLSGGAEVFITAAAEDIRAPSRLPSGRLTLTSATPVLTADVSGATIVRYTPYVGNVIPIYDGSSWNNREFSELSNTLANTSSGNAGPDATNAKPYDYFVWDNAGTLTLTRGPAWTNDTTRAAGGGLTQIDGLWVNTTAITISGGTGPGASRGTWVGTTRGNAAATTVSVLFGGAASGGTAAWFGLWNAYNRVTADFCVQDTNGSSFSTAATRSFGNSTGNRVSMVRGADEDGVHAIIAAAAVVSASGTYCYVSIGLDATNAKAARATWGYTGNTLDVVIMAQYAGRPGLGFHYLQALESTGGGGTSTIYSSTSHYNGFMGTVRY